jgi:hypothetical protein
MTSIEPEPGRIAVSFFSATNCDIVRHRRERLQPITSLFFGVIWGHLGSPREKTCLFPSQEWESLFVFLDSNGALVGSPPENRCWRTVQAQSTVLIPDIANGQDKRLILSFFSKNISPRARRSTSPQHRLGWLGAPWTGVSSVQGASVSPLTDPAPIYEPQSWSSKHSSSLVRARLILSKPLKLPCVDAMRSHCFMR